MISAGLYTIQRYLGEVHSRATSRGIVSAETKINVMKSFEKRGREYAKEKERERETQQQFINRLMSSLLVTYEIEAILISLAI